MRGSIRKRNGSYQVRWHLGEGRYKAKSFKRKKDAERFLSSVVGQVHEGTYREIKPISFEAFSKLWLETHRANIRESTKSTYEGIINRHLIPFFGRITLTAIGPDDVLRLLSQKKNLAPATINKIYTILSKMLAHAKKWHYLKNNPCKEVDTPRIPQKEMSYLTPEETKTFLSFVENEDPRYFALFKTALLTGLRQGELLALKWEDVDFRTGVLRVKRQIYQGKITEPKSKRSLRQVPLPKSLEKTLKSHKLASGPSEWVFFLRRDIALL